MKSEVRSQKSSLWSLSGAEVRRGSSTESEVRMSFSLPSLGGAGGGKSEVIKVMNNISLYKPVFPLLAQELSETSLVPPAASRTSEPPHLSDRTTLARVGGLRSMLGFLLLTSYFLLLNSCSKEKIDFAYDYSVPTHESSNIRIVNLAGYTQVTANDSLLTNGGGNVPTEYFQATGRLGRYWWIPESLLDVNGRVNLSFGGISNSNVDFQVSSSGRIAIDYYTLYPGGTGQPWVVPVERGTTAPSRPDHFKIRILNLCKTIGGLPVLGYAGAMENLVGAVTLTYADGTEVSPRTSNISISQRVSEYVEIPYGTYQFKVLAGDGRQIAASSHGVNDGYIARNMDPASSRMPVSGSGVSALTFAPVEVYEPGGIYTIVIAPASFAYLAPTSSGTATHYQNQFKIIEDISAPVNGSFGKIQIVNAEPSAGITFRLNGNLVGGHVPYGEASEYRIMEAGPYRIEAIDRTGAVVAEMEGELSGSQNHSIWFCPREEGGQQLIIVANDLSTYFYTHRYSDDASFNRFEYTMPFATRFLNLTSNIPYLSFTVDNGQDMRTFEELRARGVYQIHPSESMYNLRPGLPAVTQPYVRWRSDYPALFNFYVFRSAPGVTPGVWDEEIPILNSQSFVADEQLYLRAGRATPTFEAGIYTVAVIGRTGEGVPDNEKAKIMVVKHNK